MSKYIGQPTPVSVLIHRMRLMADSGGMITKDRRRTIIEVADRLEDLDERIAIMSENEHSPEDSVTWVSSIGGEGT